MYYRIYSPIVLFVVIICLNIKSTFSLLDTEYACAYNLVSRTFGAGYIKYVDGSTSVLDFCGNSNFTCDNGELITSAVFEQYGLEGTLTSDLFSCFILINSLTLYNFVLPNDFFIGISSRGSLKTLNLYNSKGFDIDSYTSTYLTYLQMTFNHGPTYGIKMSWLKNLKTLIISDSVLDSSITFENDITTETVSFTTFNVVSNNLPNMNKITCTNFQLKVGSNFDNNNLDSIGQTYTLVSKVTINGYKITWPFNTIPSSNIISTLVFNNQLNSQNSFISLSSFSKLTTLTMSSVGPFSVSGSFPFNSYPASLTTIIFTGSTGQITSLPNFSMNKVNKLVLSNNKFSFALPAWNRLNTNIKSLDLSLNSLSGSIDYSWCYIDVILANNPLLSGSLISCMNCYPDYKAKLVTSGFTNLADKCSTIVPNLRVDSTNKKLYLFGKDIGFSGFSSKPFTTTSSIGTPSWVIDVPNEQFTYTGYTSLPALLNVTFSTNPSQTFILSTTSTPPVINSYSIDSSARNVQFLGSYYSYNTSIVKITIDSIDCSIVNSTFDQINCIFSSSQNIDKSNIITTVCIGSLCTQITINLKGSGNINPCSPLCASPQYCLSLTGTCTCPAGFQGSDCSTPFKSCTNDCNGGLKGVCNNVTGICKCNDPFNISPDCSLVSCASNPVCSNHGTCLTSNGTCSCNQNYIGSDCSELHIPCLSNCIDSQHGTCNFTTGKCQCTSTFQGPDCSLNYKPCPNNCGGSLLGSCNNQTSICTCIDKNSISLDCSPIDCAVPNCSNHGTCNKSNGTCSCSQNYIGSDCSELHIPCLNSCIDSQHGICNFSTGICECTLNFQGPDCSLNYKPCPNNCGGSLLGSCNNQTSICTCIDKNSISQDCSPIECAVPNCSNNGFCNKSIGKCECFNGYQNENCSQTFKPCPINCIPDSQCYNVTGECLCPLSSQYYDSNLGCMCKDTLFTGKDCNIPNHYISSVQSSTILGGTAVLGGYFGEVHENLSISIGINQCKVESDLDISKYEIKCTIPPGQGKHSINITQNNLSWIGIDLYVYLPLVITCPNNCSNNGECINGVCFCNSEYSGLSCNININPNNNNPNNNPNNNNSTNNIPTTTNNINTTTGSIEINNEQDKYTISIISILELDINGGAIKEYSLDNRWKLYNKSNSIYQFKQNLVDNDDINNNCIVSYQIEQVESSKNFSFAGLVFNVPSGGLKISLSINNYTFINSLSTLQILINSSIGENENSIRNQCNNKSTLIESNNQDDEFQTFTSIQITKNEKIFIGRFSNRAIVSNSPNDMEKVTSISTSTKEKTNSNIITALNLPHSRNYYLDPDFSVLVKPEFVGKCDRNSNQNWLIPVAVVIPTVGATGLALASYLVLKKYKYFFKISYSNIKLKTINKFK